MRGLSVGGLQNCECARGAAGNTRGFESPGHPEALSAVLTRGVAGSGSASSLRKTAGMAAPASTAARRPGKGASKEAPS